MQESLWGLHLNMLKQDNAFNLPGIYSNKHFLICTHAELLSIFFICTKLVFNSDFPYLVSFYNSGINSDFTSSEWPCLITLCKLGPCSQEILYDSALFHCLRNPDYNQNTPGLSATCFNWSPSTLAMVVCHLSPGSRVAPGSYQ